MKQTTLLAAFALAVTAWATPSAEACSDLIVGKKASVDGSVMIATHVAPYFLGPLPISSMIQTSFLSAMVKDSPEL